MPAPHTIPAPQTPPDPRSGDLDALLHDLLNPHLSLSQVAEHHHLSLPQLTLLLARPDIAEQLSTLHTLAVSRARLLATNLIPQCLATLARVMDTHKSNATADAALPPEKQRSPQHQLRALESSRRAAARVLQLTRFNPPKLFAQVPQVARLSEPGITPTTAHNHVPELSPSAPQPPVAQPPHPSTPPTPEPELQTTDTGYDPDHNLELSSVADLELELEAQTAAFHTLLNQALNSADSPESLLTHATATNEHWP